MARMVWPILSVEQSRIVQPAAGVISEIALVEPAYKVNGFSVMSGMYSCNMTNNVQAPCRPTIGARVRYIVGTLAVEAWRVPVIGGTKDGGNEEGERDELSVDSHDTPSGVLTTLLLTNDESQAFYPS